MQEYLQDAYSTKHKEEVYVPMLLQELVQFQGISISLGEKPSAEQENSR